MRLKTNLPKEVHSVEYVKNNHYLRLTDDDDNSTVMFAKGFIQYLCSRLCCKPPKSAIIMIKYPPCYIILSKAFIIFIS